MPNPYLWIVIVGGIVSFLAGCGLGANDLANAFGTTYGARVLKLWQIVIVAAICEFAGAISLGGQVTSTLASGIANPMSFSDQPYVLMYGMLCAIGATTVWLALATALTLPVSSTHSIAGGIIGFALVYGGGGGVYWSRSIDDFPFFSGVAPIIASWFISPILTGIVASILFLIMRTLVFRAKNASVLAVYTLPVIVAITFFLEAFFILFKGASKKLKWSAGKAAWISICIGIGAGALTVIAVPFLLRKLRRMREEAEREAAEEGRALEDVEEDFVTGARTIEEDNHNPPFGINHGDRNAQLVEDDNNAVGEARHRRLGSSDDLAQKDDDVVVGQAIDASSRTSEDGGDDVLRAEEVKAPKKKVEVEMFDPAVEYVYRYLQIFTAICMSFAHGASDVSNSIGPFASIYDIYQKQAVSSSVEVPIWILAMGGAGIVVGLATFGQRLMSLLGEKITTITPTRGFLIELSTALVVSFASGYGIPISSTHSVTGAVVFISIVDVGIKNVKWLLVVKMYSGWIFTLVITGAVSGCFFAQGVYAPKKI